VHSGYDPRKEAQAWAEDQSREWKAGELGVVFGVGLLYHVEALVARKPQEATLAVVVPSVAELKDAASARLMEAWVTGIEWIWGTPQAMAPRCVS
jgi:spore maturation protein CgeB